MCDDGNVCKCFIGIMECLDIFILIFLLVCVKEEGVGIGMFMGMFMGFDEKDENVDDVAATS